MFTGIIESLAKVKSISKEGTNTTFILESNLTNELKVDQSVAHEGVCLTIEKIFNAENCYQVTAINETLQKTNLGNWQIGKLVNIERCLSFNGRIDGHIVQGHVDTTAECILVKDLNGSWLYRFKIDEQFSHLIIEKGSIAINGISLTIFDLTKTEFSVAIIPYTYNNTGISQLQKGDFVNVEFDIIGKYISRSQQLKQ